MKVLSIVIGNEITKVCEVSYNKLLKNKGLRVYQSISFPNPVGSVEDGFIKDIETYGEELKNQLRAGKLKADKVIFSIASSKIANREIILPPTREKRIMDIIKTGASEYFPIDLKDYILSYMILERNTSARKEKALQKKLAKQEEGHNNLWKGLIKPDKKRSNTEIIAEKMAQMDSIQVNQAPEPADQNKQENQEPKKRYLRLSVYAVPSTLVRNYYTFAKAMHLDIISLDYSGNSSYQLIKRQINRGTNVFIQMNEQDTLISILKDETLILQRTVNYGLSALADAVLDQAYYQLQNRAQAIELLEKKDILSPAMHPSETGFSRSKDEAAAASEFAMVSGTSVKENDEREYEARRNVMESLQFLTNSISRVLDYYKSNHKNTEYDSINLLGAGVKVQGIDSFFTTSIGMPLKKMEKLLAVGMAKHAANYRKNPGDFISCIGAALNPVDFIPKEYIEKKEKLSTITATLIFASVCILGSVGTIYVSISDYRLAQKQLEEVTAQAEAMPKPSSVHEELGKKKEYLLSLQELETNTHSNNDNIKEVIEALEKNLPSGTVINTMQFSETQVNMSVTVNDTGNYGANAIVAKILTQLQAIEYFDKIDTSATTLEQVDFMTKISFSITCTYAD